MEELGDERLTAEAFLRVMAELLRCTQEGHEAVAAARSCPDEALEDFVRVRTNARWRELMEEAGYVYDERSWSWVEEAEG